MFRKQLGHRDDAIFCLTTRIADDVDEMDMVRWDGKAVWDDIGLFWHLKHELYQVPGEFSAIAINLQAKVT